MDTPNKKPKKVSVDMEFLMKIAKRQDDLGAEIKLLAQKMDEKEVLATDVSPNMNYSTTFRLNSTVNVVEHRTQFLQELKQLLDRYSVIKMILDYKK